MPSQAAPTTACDWHWQRSEDHFLLSWPGARPCLSNAVLNGGFCRAGQWLNWRVDGRTEATDSAADSLQGYADGLGCRGNTVGMMTAASMNSLRGASADYRGESLGVYLSCGLSNARRAGDRADWRDESLYRPGTINMLLITSMTLTPANQVELLMLLAEAKAAVLQERDIRSPVSGAIATGTGTDACAIIGGQGRSSAWFGKHTEVGEISATLAMAVLRSAIDRADSHRLQAIDGDPPGAGR